MNGLIIFLLGAMYGGVFGIFFMCLFIAGGNDERRDDDAPPE
ncbi:MAG: DUF3789 domain-containing protein [Eubacteriales bacterium]|nr:DUF3789 domain-containing protein [Eubacteriales bacterium]